MNTAETELLISLVKPHQCLYDQSHDDYKQAEVKEAIWADIANAMNKDVNTLRSDWKKLRDCHRDAMKRRIFPQTEKDAKISKKWKYEDQMEFLLNFMTNRHGKPYIIDQNTSGIAYDDTNENSVPQAETYSPDSEDEPPPKKSTNSTFHSRKSTRATNSSPSFIDANNLSSLLPVHSNELANELELFFNAMCATTKRLPVRYQIQIKKEIFKIVTESEEAAYEKGQL